MFSCTFCETFKITFVAGHLRVIASVNVFFYFSIFQCSAANSLKCWKTLIKDGAFFENSEPFLAAFTLSNIYDGTFVRKLLMETR